VVCYKALTEHNSHDHDSDNDVHDRRAVWHGLITLGGIYLFFVVERIVGLYSERKRMQNEQRLKVGICLTIVLCAASVWETTVSQAPVLDL